MRWRRALDRRVIVGAYGLAAATETAVCAGIGAENNFRIFRASFVNLVAGRDLCTAHPAQHLDLFKYSPTSALLFAPFAVGDGALSRSLEARLGRTVVSSRRRRDPRPAG